MCSLEVSNNASDPPGPLGVKAFSEILVGKTTYQIDIRFPSHIEPRKGRHYQKQILPDFDMFRNQEIHQIPQAELKDILFLKMPL